MEKGLNQFLDMVVYYLIFYTSISLYDTFVWSLHGEIHQKW